MDSMIKMLGGALTPQIMGSLANLTGESQAGTKSIADSAISTLVGALSQAGGTESGAQSILDMLNKPQNGLNVDDVAGDFAGILGDSGRRDSLMGAGDGILSSLIPGGKMNGILDLVTGASGVKRGSSSMIMKLVAPLAMGLLRRHVMSKGLGALGLSKFLGGQRQFVQEANPGLGSILGFGADRDQGTVDRTTSRTQTDHRTTVKTPEPKQGGGLPGWLLPLLGVLLLGLLAWWFIGNRGGDDAAVEEPTFCGEVATLNDGIINKLPLIEEGMNLGEGDFAEQFGALTETVDNIGDIVRKDDSLPSIVGLESAWDVLKEVVDDNLVDQADVAISGVEDAVTPLVESCPVN